MTINLKKHPISILLSFIVNSFSYSTKNLFYVFSPLTSNPQYSALPLPLTLGWWPWSVVHWKMKSNQKKKSSFSYHWIFQPNCIGPIHSVFLPDTMDDLSLVHLNQPSTVRWIPFLLPYWEVLLLKFFYPPFLLPPHFPSLNWIVSISM